MIRAGSYEKGRWFFTLFDDSMISMTYARTLAHTGEVFNIGGTRFSNCSILEAVNLIEKITSKKMKIKFSKQQKTVDHQWYITNMQKFYKYYPKYKLTYSIKNILEEIINGWE
jgi:hypothetical protein